VWGMPAAADAIGAAQQLVPLAELVDVLLRAAGEGRATQRGSVGS
jgi:hypothetical protein